MDMGGLELVVDSIRKPDGSLVAADGDALTPQSAPAANAGVAATDGATTPTVFTITATTGSFPTPDGAWTVADAATPTVAELQEGVLEDRLNIVQLIAAVAALKVTVAALIVENATFKTSINAHRTALLAAGVYI